MDAKVGAAIGIISALIVAGAFTGGFGTLNVAGGDNGGDGNYTEPTGDTLSGESASVSAAVFNQAGDSQEQVAATTHMWRQESDESFYLGSKDSGTNSRAEFTEFVTGTTAEAVAFNDQYDYGETQTKEIDDSSELMNLNVWEGASTSSIEVQVVDNSGSSVSSVSLGPDQQKTLSGLKAYVNTNSGTYNPKLVLVGKEDGSNVSVDINGAEQVPVPESVSDSFDKAYAAFSANEGEPILGPYEETKSGNIVLQADSDGANGEEIGLATMDLAPFVHNGEVRFGVENMDSTPEVTGVGPVSTSLTAN